MSPGGSTMASFEDVNSFLAQDTPPDHLIRTYFEQIGVIPKVVFNILEKLVLLLGRHPFNNEIPCVVFEGGVIHIHNAFVQDEMAEDVFGAYWLGSGRVILDKGVLVITRLRFLLAGGGRHLKRHTKGRKTIARLSGGHFIGRLTHHFGLVSDDGLRGLSVVAYELPLIDMGELVKINICMDIGDEWAWVASGPERQQVVAAGAPEATQDALAVDKGTQADPAPVKFTLVDDEGKHLENVDSSGDHDGEDEVKVVDTNSLLEQWKETYENADYDYDPYDNDMYEG
ncbi:hypothetical protein Tco_0218751 [Tanacetum coccineum]